MGEIVRRPSIARGLQQEANLSFSKTPPLPGLEGGVGTEILLGFVSSAPKSEAPPSASLLATSSRSGQSPHSIGLWADGAGLQEQSANQLGLGRRAFREV